MKFFLLAAVFLLAHASREPKDPPAGYERSQMKKRKSRHTRLTLDAYIDKLPAFPEGGPQPNHVMQHLYGNCWFLVALQAFCKYPWFQDLIKELDPLNGNRRWSIRFNTVEKNEAGKIFAYRDYIVSDEYAKVITSHRYEHSYPSVCGHFCFKTPGQVYPEPLPTCLWPLLFQDALIQHMGRGEDLSEKTSAAVVKLISGNKTCNAISLFTQYPYKHVSSTSFEDYLKLQYYLKKPGYDLLLAHRGHAFVIEKIEDSVSYSGPMVTLIEPGSHMPCIYRHAASSGGYCPLSREDMRDDSFPSQGRIVVPFRVLSNSEVCVSISNPGKTEMSNWVVDYVDTLEEGQLQRFINDGEGFPITAKDETMYLGVCQQPRSFFGGLQFKLYHDSGTSRREMPFPPGSRFSFPDREQIYVKVTGLTIGETYTLVPVTYPGKPTIKGPVAIKVLYEKPAPQAVSGTVDPAQLHALGERQETIIDRLKRMPEQAVQMHPSSHAPTSPHHPNDEYELFL